MQRSRRWGLQARLANRPPLPSLPFPSLSPPRSYTKLYKKHAKMLFPRISGGALCPPCGWANLGCMLCIAQLVLWGCLAAPPHPMPTNAASPCGPAEHDKLDITAGVPYPGRPQIGSGDNVSAHGPPAAAQLPHLALASAAVVGLMLCWPCSSSCSAIQRARRAQGPGLQATPWRLHGLDASPHCPPDCPLPAAVGAGPHTLPHLQRGPARPRGGQLWQQWRGCAPRGDGVSRHASL